MSRILPALLIAFAAASTASAQTTAPTAPAATMAKPTKQFEIINPVSVEPIKLLPRPSAAGSAAEVDELVALHLLIAHTTPARMEQAKWDDEHEDPAIFNEAIGRDLKALPATWSLLLSVQNDANLAGNLSKKFFGRIRPWGADASLPNCDTGKGKKPLGSYPSGHSVLGYSVGWALAQLMPEKAEPILTRAQDYALSREICGVHFRSDTEASHVIGTYVAGMMFADKRFASRIAAAKAELAAH